MLVRGCGRYGVALMVAQGLLVFVTVPAEAQLRLGPETLVQAGGANITVAGYSVPSLACWDGDELPDLIVGEGSSAVTGRVRVYLNVGTRSAPQFSTFFYAQSNGADLTSPGSGCMGLFPRLVNWGGISTKNLLVGQALGTVKLFLNTGTNAIPAFDGGTLLQVGQPGAKVNINVGTRATPTVVDWDNDGRRDLVVGDINGWIHVFHNGGTDAAPDFRTDTLVQANGSILAVPSGRASPVVGDFDGDGKKDILTGNTNGQLLFYPNVGTNAAPAFSGYSAVLSNGVAIYLPGSPRSRPFACDWTGDGRWNVLIGAGDAKVHLYRGALADCDRDGDVDLDDFALFEACFNGPNRPKALGCTAAGDFDGDADVDLKDFATFRTCFNGPDRPPACG